MFERPANDAERIKREESKMRTIIIYNICTPRVDFAIRNRLINNFNLENLVARIFDAHVIISNQSNNASIHCARTHGTCCTFCECQRLAGKLVIYLKLLIMDINL